MPTRAKFLIVDDNPDSRFLLVKTLLRKFPQGILYECRDGSEAIEHTQKESLTAIVVHRGAEVDGVTLIRSLRAVNPTVPILMVSGRDRAKEALAAGANHFLSYEAWLRVGTVVSELLEGGARNSSEAVATSAE